MLHITSLDDGLDIFKEAIVIIELDDFRLRVVFPQKRTALIL